MKKFALFLFLLIGAGLFSHKLVAQISTTPTSLAAPSSPQVQQTPLNLPLSIVYRVLNQAQVPLNTSFQVLMAEYYNGNCKIKDLGITPLGDLRFEVKYAGGATIISIDINT